MKKTAIIVGVTGQDGAYLARLLLDKGIRVVGTSRNPDLAPLHGLKQTGALEEIELVSLDSTDPRAVISLLTAFDPQMVFNLGGQSSVGDSFVHPARTMASIVNATGALLEGIRVSGSKARFYNAGSSESFGDTHGVPASADSALRPLSPYGVAKASAAMLVKSYRESFGIFAVTGHLFNHESPLRPTRFVTAKIVHAAAMIAAGDEQKLSLGDLRIARDWGWAPEYVEAMSRMLEQDEPVDIVVATGTIMKLSEFAEYAFDWFGLDWRNYVTSDPGLARPNELLTSCGDPAKAERILGWRAATYGKDLVGQLCGAAHKVLRSASN
jgi:GDPmannose 4,6-dehydratase